jgi:hypothetical protein
VESEFSASSWIYVFWTIWCLQGKVLVEAKKDEKVEIPDEVTIENKVCSSSKLSPPFDRVLKWASSSMFSFVLSGSKGMYQSVPMNLCLS